MTYMVQKLHTYGVLKGLTTEEFTSVKFTVGKEYFPCSHKRAYIVLTCQEIFPK